VGSRGDGTALFFDGTHTLLLGNYGNEWVAPGGISNQGNVVGSFDTTSNDEEYSTRPFALREGVFSDLGPLLGARNGGAEDINDRDQFVGTAYAVGEHGFLISGNTVIDLDGVPNDNWAWFRPRSINNSAEVTGQMEVDLDPGPGEYLAFHAFRWREGTILDLGTFGAFDDSSYGADVNDAGVVVGWANDWGPSQERRTFVHSARRMVALPNLRPDIRNPTRTAEAINNYGVVVGQSPLDYIWSGGVISELMAAVDMNGTGLSSIHSPKAINDRGQILASGFSLSTGIVAVILDPIPPTGPPTKLVNVSARAATRIGDGTLIAGFSVAGGDGMVLARVVGPGLLDHDVAGAASDPQLDLYRAGIPDAIDTNDQWGDAPDPALIAATAARVNAFALETDSTDAALVSTLSAGDYTMHATAATPDDGGIVLAEVYDATETTSIGQLVNASMRLWVGTDEEIGIVGFVLAGEHPAKVLIRAIGPGLTSHGVGDVLADPQLFLYRESDATLGNDDWGSAAGFPLLASATTQTGAFPLADNSKDAALVLQLEPGTYTVHVTGAGGATGVALVEIYLLSE